jgi:hypothetical protein
VLEPLICRFERLKRFLLVGLRGKKKILPEGELANKPHRNINGANSNKNKSGQRGYNKEIKVN